MKITEIEETKKRRKERKKNNNNSARTQHPGVWSHFRSHLKHRFLFSTSNLSLSLSHTLTHHRGAVCDSVAAVALPRQKVARKTFNREREKYAHHLISELSLIFTVEFLTVSCVRFFFVLAHSVFTFHTTDSCTANKATTTPCTTPTTVTTMAKKQVHKETS